MFKLITILFPLFLLADTGTLIKIVDGDTLNFNTNSKIVKCRIEYIDTPESSNNNKNKRDVKNCKNVSQKDMKSAGKSATRAATRLLTLNKQYEYEVSDKDHYERSICVVKLDEVTFNEQMILNGYAVPYRQYMNQSELRHYNFLLSTAKANKAGLWKDRKEVIECLDKARKR
jgi:micrococcal nuclease